MPNYKKKNILVILYFDEDDGPIILTGYIKEIQEETITIDVIDEYGRKDGEHIINIEIIDQIDINSIDNREIELRLD